MTVSDLTLVFFPGPVCFVVDSVCMVPPAGAEGVVDAVWPTVTAAEHSAMATNIPVLRCMICPPEIPKEGPHAGGDIKNHARIERPRVILPSMFRVLLAATLSLAAASGSLAVPAPAPTP